MSWFGASETLFDHDEDNRRRLSYEDPNSYSPLPSSDYLLFADNEAEDRIQEFEEGAQFSESMLEFVAASDRDYPTRRVSTGAVANLRRQLPEYIILALVVSAWLGCSCMNSNAMKELEQSLRHPVGDSRRRLSGPASSNIDAIIIVGGNADSQILTSRTDYLLCIIAMTSLVTAVQLMVGALLGCLLVIVHSHLRNRSTKQAIKRCFAAQPYGYVQNNMLLALPVLHAMASVFSNLGFMHDSASLVQIIKLLEPLETFVLTDLYLGGSQERRRLTLGVFSSVILTVSAAYFTLKTSQAEARLDAVVFALIAGIASVCRNVLKRHHEVQKLEVPTSFDAPTRRDGPYNIMLRGSSILKSSRRELNAAKFERALIQFTRLSFQSGIFVSLLAGVLHCSFYGTLPSSRGVTDHYLSEEKGRILEWGVFSWQPLYSACSIVALCFCSALTHSLVSAGQGVVNVTLEIAWFQQPLTAAYASSFALVSVGACWYIIESKQAEEVAAARCRNSINGQTEDDHSITYGQQQGQPRTSLASRILRWAKPLIAVALLNLVSGISSTDSALH